MNIKMKTSVIALLTAAAATPTSTANAQGFSAGVDVGYMVIAHSEGQTLGFATVVPEVWVEYETANGLIFGLDWSLLDATSTDPTTRYDRIVMQSVDLNVGRAFTLGDNTSVKLQGGMRLATYREENLSGTGYLEVPVAYGIGAGVEVNHALSGNFSIFGAASSTIMLGQVIENGTPDNDIIFNTTDLEIGVQYNGNMSSGGAWFARAGLSAKLWNGVSDGDSEDTAALGAAFSVGLTF